MTPRGALILLSHLHPVEGFSSFALLTPVIAD
jgi:hypothetical protein